VSGSLAADLLGRILRSRGKVAVTLSDLAINEHAEKSNTFTETLQRFHPDIQVVEIIEDHDIETEAYEKCRSLFAAHPDLVGIYVATEASIPVLNAARDAGILSQLSIITTDHPRRTCDRNHRSTALYTRATGIPSITPVPGGRIVPQLPGDAFSAHGNARKSGILPAASIFGNKNRQRPG
jgi:ABC-type sugar transport system substrate-binding protein